LQVVYLLDEQIVVDLKIFERLSILGERSALIKERTEGKHRVKKHNSDRRKNQSGSERFAGNVHLPSEVFLCGLRVDTPQH
jgi:hypothetical protein